MVNKHRNPVIILILGLCTALLMGACLDDLVRPPGNYVFDPNRFWVVDFTTSNYYQISADKIFDGNNCEIWAERGSEINEKQAQEIANEYDNKIHELMLQNFSIDSVSYTSGGTEKNFNNILELANYLVNGNGKLIILLLDIRDLYGVNGNNSYIAGYFDPVNFYLNYSNSNFRNMIYIDINPGMKDKTGMYSTFAHELQHLINYVTSMCRRSREKSDIPNRLDTWIDEGLSSQAEHLYQGKPLDGRINWFLGNNTSKGLIDKGNNFFVWGNHANTDYTELDDYATVYLFFTWLYIQSGENAAIFKDIINSTRTDYRAVTEMAAKIESGWGTWETLLRTWHIANYLNTSTGRFGYEHKNDSRNRLSAITVKPLAGTTNISLYPGEAVYSRISACAVTPTISSVNIRYAGLTKGSTVVNLAPPSYSGAMLLTFNANNSRHGNAEPGYLTGVSANMGISAATAFLEETPIDLPAMYIIDHRDLLRNK